MRLSWPCFLLLSVASLLPAQHGSTTRSNPFDTPADRVDGARLFRTQCAGCHGPLGNGGAVGPNLTGNVLRRGDSDDQLYQVVLKGIPGTNMPPFPGNGREVWQVVGYLRTLRDAKAVATKGDSARGAKLLDQRGCRQCHSVHGQGAAVGPELAEIGSLRSVAQLYAALTEPDREVAPEYWMLRARTHSGQKIIGVRLNEDTFSYQYRDRTGLRAVLKEELAEHETVPASPMPSFAGKLSTRDLDDLVAYLASLRRGARP